LSDRSFAGRIFNQVFPEAESIEQEEQIGAEEGTRGGGTSLRQFGAREKKYQINCEANCRNGDERKYRKKPIK
jgi:hypothetical protein